MDGRVGGCGGQLQREGPAPTPRRAAGAAGRWGHRLPRVQGVLSGPNLWLREGAEASPQGLHKLWRAGLCSGEGGRGLREGSLSSQRLRWRHTCSQACTCMYTHTHTYSRLGHRISQGGLGLGCQTWSPGWFDPSGTGQSCGRAVWSLRGSMSLELTAMALARLATGSPWGERGQHS